MEAWIGVAGTVVAALLAFVFGRVNLSRASDHERFEALRQQRLQVLASFCSAMVQYRRAQLQRWFDRRDDDGDDAEGDASRAAAEAVRTARADAWSAYYQLLMLTDDDTITRAAQGLLQVTRDMKNATSADDVEVRSDRVHDAIDEFARLCLPLVASEVPRGTRPKARGLR